VCGPSLRDCLVCWLLGNTEARKLVIEREANSLDINQAETLFSQNGLRDVTSVLSLIVPGAKFRQMEFAKLSPFVERLVMTRVITANAEAARRMLTLMTRIPDVHSVGGRVWETLGHRYVLHEENHFLRSLTSETSNRTIRRVGPPVDCWVISDIPVRAQDVVRCPCLPTGYFQPVSQTQATVDSVAILDETDENGSDFQHIVFFQCTVSTDHSAKSRGIKDFAKALRTRGYSQLLPYEHHSLAPTPSRRYNWSFVWVVPKQLEYSVKPKEFVALGTHSTPSWINDKIDQYVLALNIPECSTLGTSYMNCLLLSSHRGCSIALRPD
jgi:hypothetical protein